MMALDPVCGMTVDPARAAGQVDHEGTTYYFCSKGCAAKFAADPQKYLTGKREPMTPQTISLGSLTRQPQSAVRSPIRNPQSAIGNEWVCPMDP